jgi:hypothetical protein
LPAGTLGSAAAGALPVVHSTRGGRWWWRGGGRSEPVMAVVPLHDASLLTRHAGCTRRAAHAHVRQRVCIGRVPPPNPTHLLAPALAPAAGCPAPLPPALPALPLGPPHPCPAAAAAAATAAAAVHTGRGQQYTQGQQYSGAQESE